jgi:hypothetical protein
MARLTVAAISRPSSVTSRTAIEATLSMSSAVNGEV